VYYMFFRLAIINVLCVLRLAIIGVSDQFIEQRIDRDKYIDSISQLQPHVSRLNHR